MDTQSLERKLNRELALIWQEHRDNSQQFSAAVGQYVKRKFAVPDTEICTIREQLDDPDAPDPEYDPLIHITAGELREQGIAIDSYIPDCAFTTRSSVKFGLNRTEDVTTAKFNLTITIEDSFVWMTVTLEKGEVIRGS